MDEWLTISLKDAIKPGRGISYGIVQPGANVPDGVPIIRVGDIRNGRLSTHAPLRVRPDIEQQYSRTRLTGGELLITIVGTVGETVIAPKEVAGWNVARAVAVLPVRDDISAHWVQLALKAPSVRALIDSRLNTTVQPTLNLGDLALLPILLPPPKQRRSIASVLGALESKINASHRMNETLEAIQRAIFKDWFVDFGPTRAKMAGRAPYLAPEIWALFPDRLDNEGKPAGWEFRPVSAFAELEGGKQLGKELIAENGPVPVFGGAGVMGYTTNHNADGFVISVGRVGAYCGQFFSFRGKAWINNNASLIRPKSEVSGEWLFVALIHADIEVIKKGAAQPFVSNRDIAKMALTWPGRQVVSAFSNLLIPLMLKSERNDMEAKALAETRDALLPKLMSGEIHVRDEVKIVEAAL